jgi:hypothetical protein
MDNAFPVINKHRSWTSIRTDVHSDQTALLTNIMILATNANLAKLVLLIIPIPEDVKSIKLTPTAHVTKNTILVQGYVLDAQMDRPVITLTEDVHQKTTTVPILVKSHSSKTNAMHAKLAPKERFTTETLTLVPLKYKDHNAHATNNSTRISTDVTHVQMANSQVTLTLSKVVSADNSLRTVVTKWDWTNNNAMDAKHAHSDKSITARLTLVPLKYKDHNAHATNNSTSNSTDVTLVQ